MSLPTTCDGPIHIAVIGGTGISHLEHEGFTAVACLTVDTPWGAPSSPITVLQTPHSSAPIAFLSRHGLHHELTPTEVPSRANIAALRSLGVTTILAFSAVGSLREEVAPRDFIVPDQIIDRTKGTRPHTFFSNGVVGHVGFADPFDEPLRQAIISVAGSLKEYVKLHAGGTLVCIEGPQFSTRAESNLYRSWGGSVINMSAIPESKLAREAEIAYAIVCMSTDYDCWKLDEKPVDVAGVMANMKANGENAKRLMSKVLEALAEEDKKGVWGARLRGTSKFAVCTAKAGMKRETVEKLEWLFGGDFFA